MCRSRSVEMRVLMNSRKDNAAKKKPIFLEDKCWSLLLELLAGNSLSSGSTIVHTKLLTVISLIFNTTFLDINNGAKSDSQRTLLSTAHKILDLLVKRYETSFKPTFEQFGQFINDMIKIHAHIMTDSTSDNLNGPIESYLGVLDLGLKEFARQLADQPNQKKVQYHTWYN